MEYLVVLFPRSRRLVIDGELRGYTNELIELEGGEHRVSLGPPANFTPQSPRRIDLRNTSELMPHTILFKPKAS